MASPTLDAFFASCPAMLFVGQLDGSLDHVSAALQRGFSHCLGSKPSLAELASPDDATALEAFMSALETSEDEVSCTLHPHAAEGSDARLEVRCRARRDADGFVHGQLELVEHSGEISAAVGEQLEHTLLHALMGTLDIILWAVDSEGVFRFHQGKALAQAGMEQGQFVGLRIYDIYPPEVHGPIKDAFQGRVNHNIQELHGIHWENWLLPLEMEDGETWCAGITLDVTERVTSQRSLEDQLDTIQTQQVAIYELSAPVLNVWDKVLAVPLIGIMDADRTDELTDRLLEAAHRGQTRFAILDLTGVEAVDTTIAAHVLGLLKSLRLLGVEGLVTGVSPEVARTMVGVGIDFEHVQTHRTLREGLRHCMRTLLAAERT